jgi:hypothetical protein
MFLKKKQVAEMPEDQVVLKPIFGIKPGIYLAGLYGLLIIMALFFILLYPGLSKPGSVFSVSSEPSGAAFFVDGVYQAATPATVFVPKGSHQLTMSLPAFDAWQREITVENRAFASLFFPKRVNIDGALTAPNPVAALTQGASEYAAWSFAGEPTAAYQIPQPLSEAAYRTGAASPKIRAAMDETLKAAGRFASNRASLRDLIRAKCLVDNAGVSPSPLSLIASAQAVAAYLSANPHAAQAVAALLPPDSAAVLKNTAWYQNQTISAQTGFSESTVHSRLQGRMNAGGLSFREIDSGTLTQKNGRSQKIEAFFIAETEVSRSSWEVFLEANPQWKAENAQTLIAAGLADEDYLVQTEVDAQTVIGVSWYAAQAYCQWLTASLPDASYEARLPFEAEWEAAAQAGYIQASRHEWCADHYAPMPFSATQEGIEAVGSPERSVRGGFTLDVETRASLPPAKC